MELVFYTDILIINLHILSIIVLGLFSIKDSSKPIENTIVSILMNILLIFMNELFTNELYLLFTKYIILHYCGND